MAAIFQLMLNQSKQQSDLVVALLNRQVEATSKAPHVNELGELLKLAKEIGGMTRGRGGDDEDESIFGTTIGSIGASLLKTWQLETEHRLNNPPAPTDPPAAPTHNRPRAHTPRPTAPLNVPAVAGVGQAAGAPPNAPAATRPRRATPAPDPNSVAGKVRIIARLVLATAEDPTRDPAAFADVMASILGEDLAEQLVSTLPAGQIAEQLIKQIPQLRPSAAFLDDVELSLREQFDPPADDQAGDVDTTSSRPPAEQDTAGGPLPATGA